MTLVCACCPSPATHHFSLLIDGETRTKDVCQKCGEMLQAQMEEMHEAKTQLQRAGVDERMASRIISERIERKELCADVYGEDE